jgi:hypothetical protein
LPPNFENLIDNINEIKDLSDFYKEKLLKIILEAQELEGKTPISEQRISDEFYESSLLPGLSTGDLIDVKTLDKNLTKLHNDLGLYEGTFANKFYPYFFERYNLACVATQECKIAHESARVIEICALKPLDIIACDLAPSKRREVRSKVLTSKDAIDKSFVDKFRKLFDQQIDNSFLYHDYYHGNQLKRPAFVACIDIKIPIRVNATDKNSNVPEMEKSRISSIRPLFRSKLGEKIARHYINVALQDNIELFKNPEAHVNWLNTKIKECYLIVENPLVRDQIENFISNKWQGLTSESIWSDEKNVTEILAEQARILVSASATTHSKI